MKLATVKAIVKAAEDMGEELKVYEGYSGRGMYGRKTTGITYDNEGTLLSAVAMAAANLQRDGEFTTEQDTYEDEDTGETVVAAEPETITLEEFIQDVSRVSKDNMGRSMIAY